MKYELERRDLKIEKTIPRVRLIAETASEAKMLKELEQELDSSFGRGHYVLRFASSGQNLEDKGPFTLEYYILKK